MATLPEIAEFIAEFLEDRVNDAEGNVVIINSLDESEILIVIGGKNYSIVIRELL